MPITPYLSFNGNCREVMDFYRDVFGGEYQVMVTFAEAPPEMGVPESELGNIMHAALKFGDNVIMGSDVPSNYGMPVVAGSNFSLSVNPESKEQTDELFAKLSEGGDARLPPEVTFWGAYFAMCVDKHGIAWQFNFEMGEK